MRSEILISDTSFSWLAREMFRSREAGSIRGATPVREVPRLQPQRLPVDFSADVAILNARQTRSLYLGELLGSGVKAVSDAITAVAGKLLGRTVADDTALEQSREFDKAA